MLTREQLTVGLNAVCDQITAMCRDHEIADHGGEVCPGNRVSAVAFVAHRLGMKAGVPSAAAFATMLLEYELNCPNCRHQDADPAEGSPR